VQLQQATNWLVQRPGLAPLATKFRYG